MSTNGFLNFSECPFTNAIEKNHKLRNWDEIPYDILGNNVNLIKLIMNAI
jgi:hypothetical protein